MTPTRLRPALPAPAGPDSALLAAFAAGRDEAAFAALVRRHARMVRAAARRVLGDPAAADDAAQAAFIALARRASRSGWGPTVGPWLYRVVVRLAVRAKVRAARRPAPCGLDAEPPGPTADPAARLSWEEVRVALDDGLARLPERLRAPLVLCYLEGLTRDEAASALGCTPDAVRGRLERGRDRLRHYLAGQGLGLPAALAGLLTADPGARAGFAAETARAAADYLSGRPVPAGVVALLAGSSGPGWRAVAGVIVALSGALGVAGLARPDAEPVPAPRAAGGPQPVAAGPRVDALGDPLPAGALARMGSARLHHGRNLRGVAVSPDGKLVASLGHDGSNKLWDADTGREVPLRVGPGKVVRVAPAGGRLAALVHHGDAARLVGLPDGPTTEVRGFAPAHAGITCWLSADGKTLVWPDPVFDPAGRHEWRVNVTDAATGTTTTLCAREKEFAHEVRLSADGRTAAVMFSDRSLEVWDLPARALLFAVPKAEAKFFEGFALSADGRTAARVDPAAKVVRLWDVRSGKELPLLPDQPGTPYATLAFSPDGRTLACGATGVDQLPAVRLWDWRAGKTLRTFPCYSSAAEVAFSADGRRLVGACGDGVRVWDPATGRPGHDWGHDYSVWSVAWSPDGARLATAAVYSDRVGRVWDARTGRKLLELRGHRLGVIDLAVSPDGRLVATASHDRTVRLWDAATGAAAHAFETDDGTGYAAAFSPDGRHLTVGGEASLRVFDLRTRTEVRTFPFPKPGPHRAWFGADGRVLVQGRFTYGLHAFDLASGREETLLPENTVLAVSPDRRRAVTGVRGESTAGPLRLRDLATGAERVRLGPAKDDAGELDPMAAAFSPDGRAVAVAYRRGLTVVYEAATGGERLRFAGHANDVLVAAYSPDGTRLATGSGDHTALVWDATGELLLADPVAAPRDVPDAWERLAGPDARAAYAAVRFLAGRPAEAVPYLAGRLRPVQGADAARVAGLVGKLDSPAFAEREEAARELAGLGDVVGDALREAAGSSPSAEVRARAGRLLAGLGGRLSGDGLRSARAVEVLERVGSGEARRVLGRLAGGAPGTGPTEDARRALARLSQAAR